MKKLLFSFGFMLVSAVSFAQAQKQVWVNGYTNSNGTYVQGYYKTVSDNIATNNYSYQGNVNPNTNTQGTKPLYQNTTPTENRTLYTGTRGGTYYINSNGNKVYVKIN
jgi:hypothetical protein